MFIVSPGGEGRLEVDFFPEHGSVEKQTDDKLLGVRYTSLCE